MRKSCIRLAYPILAMVVSVSLFFMSCGTSTTSVIVGSTTGTTKPTPSPTSTITPKSGGVLRVVPRVITNAFGYGVDFGSSGGLELSYPCVESICGVDLKGNFIPRLATGYEVAPDGQSITFTLRKGVKFHDGTELNASAIKWNLEQMKKGRFVGTETWASDPVVDVIDDNTVRLNLKTFTNNLIYQLASSSRIVSPTAVEQNPSDAHTRPVGTGPFKFVSFTPDVNVIYERNDDYWGDKPYLDGIEYIYIKDDMAKSAAILSGDVDMLFNVTTETGIALRSKGYYVNYGNPNLIGLIPDSANTDSPLSNLKVREAIEYAIDRDSLAKLGNGFWEPANQPCTPNTPGYIANFKGRNYDPELAKQLLSETGYSNGFDLKLIYAQSNIQTPDSMVAVQQYLSKVGITLDLQQIPTIQRNTIASEGWKNGFIAFILYTGFGFISGLQYNFTSSLYVSTDKPSELKELLTQAASATDSVSLETSTQKIINLIHDNLTFIPLWIAPQQVYVQQTYVHDTGLYEKGGTMDWNPEKAWISK